MLKGEAGKLVEQACDPNSKLEAKDLYKRLSDLGHSISLNTIRSHLKRRRSGIKPKIRSPKIETSSKEVLGNTVNSSVIEQTGKELVLYKPRFLVSSFVVTPEENILAPTAESAVEVAKLLRK
jgi:hypothetical protein